MIRGTTPKRKRTYPKMLTYCVAAFWQTEGDELVVTPEVQETNTGCLVTITLTQEQTLAFSLGALFWQIRGLCEDGAVASEVYSEIVTDVHPEGVIEAPVTLGTPPAEPEEPTDEEHEEPSEEPEDEPEEEPAEESAEEQEEPDETEQ